MRKVNVGLRKNLIRTNFPAPMITIEHIRESADEHSCFNPRSNSTFPFTIEITCLMFQIYFALGTLTANTKAAITNTIPPEAMQQHTKFDQCCSSVKKLIKVRIDPSTIKVTISVFRVGDIGINIKISHFKSNKMF